MVRPTILFSVILFILGVVFYVMTGMKSLTALIPSVLGILMGLCGYIALDHNRLKVAMHSAVVIGLVGLVATLKGLWKGVWMLFGMEVERPVAVVEQCITAIICLIFVVMCFKWFVRNRRARTPSVMGS